MSDNVTWWSEFYEAVLSIRVHMIEEFIKKFGDKILSQAQKTMLPLINTNSKVLKTWVQFETGRISAKEAFDKVRHWDEILKFPQIQPQGLAAFWDIKISYLEEIGETDLELILEAHSKTNTYLLNTTKKVRLKVTLGGVVQKMV